jgi:TonB family protein
MRWGMDIIAAMTRIATVLLMLLSFGSALSVAQKASLDLPEKLVIAQHFFIDVGPPNDFYELIQLSPAGDTVNVERVLITPEGSRCLSPAKVETRNAIFHKSMKDLLENRNPCAIPEKELHRELKRCKKCLNFSGENVTIEANCGGKQRVMRMDVLERDIFGSQPNTPGNTSWTMRLLQQIDDATGPGALDKPIFATGVPEPVEAETETATVQSLREGVFDSLFGRNAGISEIIREAQETRPPPSVELVSAEPFSPISPLMPKYPPIANAARVEGKVNLTFDLDSSGRVENIETASEARATMLRSAAEAAVANWKFPEAAFGSEIHATLRFSLNCQDLVRTSVN